MWRLFSVQSRGSILSVFRLGVLWLAVLVLVGCNLQNNLTDDNLLYGARAAAYELGHGALCARLPSVQAIDDYANERIPENSAVGRNVKAWDLSGLLDIFQTRDGRWVIMASSGLKKLEGVHFRKGPSGENDALCFGRLWVERLIEYRKDDPLGIEGAVTARFEARLRDAHMLQYFRHLKVEPFDPNLFTLTTGVAFGDTLAPSFAIDVALAPTQLGWFLAKSVLENPIP